MKFKNFIYLLLLIALFGGIAYGVSYTKNYKATKQTDQLHSILNSFSHEKKFKLLFFVPERPDVFIGDFYKVSKKTENNKFELSTKANYTFRVPKHSGNAANLHEYENEKYDDTLTVPLSIISDLLKSNIMYRLTFKSNASMDYSEQLNVQRKWEYLENIFGNNFGLDSMLVSTIMVFFILIGFHYITIKLQNYIERDFSFILTLIAIVVGFRIIIGLHSGMRFFTSGNLVAYFIPLILEMAFLSIPLFIYRLTIAKSKKNLDFIDKELLRAIIIFVVFIVFILSFQKIQTLSVDQDFHPLVHEISGNKYYYFSGSVFPRAVGLLPFISTILAFALHNIFLHLLSEWRESKMHRIREEELTKSEAKLNEIQSSVNPHFLYNSFNSIAALAKINPEKTKQMTLALSKFYKYTTNRNEASYSSIREEIEMINTYLEIEKIRFGDKLIFEIDLDEKLEEHKIPYFSLQPIVENAIKYGYNEDRNEIKIKLVISATESDIMIKVYDSGKAFPDEFSKGYGLKSISKKLKLLYPSQHELSFHNKPKHVSIILKNQIDV